MRQMESRQTTRVIRQLWTTLLDRQVATQAACQMPSATTADTSTPTKRPEYVGASDSSFYARSVWRPIDLSACAAYFGKRLIAVSATETRFVPILCECAERSTDGVCRRCGWQYPPLDHCTMSSLTLPPPTTAYYPRHPLGRRFQLLTLFLPLPLSFLALPLPALAFLSA